jgi:DNA-directed RNA polymerase specialized sigma24 family protein
MLEHPSLKPEHRVCLTLHYVHGMENREITSYTGLTANQVKSCLQYGLKLLRKAFGAGEGAE